MKCEICQNDIVDGMPVACDTCVQLTIADHKKVADDYLELQAQVQILNDALTNLTARVQTLLNHQ